MIRNDERTLREPFMGEMPLAFRFRQAYRDPQASITAVNDFDSFVRIFRSNGRHRIDRLKKLYNLYLAISKTTLSLSMDQLRAFKATVSGYEKVSITFFLDDLKELASMGIIIVDTPTIKAIKSQRELDRLREICKERGIEPIDIREQL